MTIKKELTCQYCNEIYKQPIALPCGDSICKHHIEELISNNSINKFNCPLCNKENLNQELNPNKILEKLIKIELHEFKINPIYETVLNNLQTEIGNLEAIVKDPEYHIFEEISELKRQVDLDRERLKSEIDSLADGLIKQLESYEQQFKTEYKTNIDLEHYNNLLESSKKQLANYEHCLTLFSSKNQERYKSRIESENIIKQLKRKIKKFKEKLLSNLSIKYEPKQNEMDDMFGTFIIKVSSLF